MHEISLVRTIFRTLDEQFTPEELQGIMAVRLKIGPLANVEPTLLRNAFEAVVEEDETRFRNIDLQINMVPILVHCEQCQKTTEVLAYRFVCAACGTPTANVVQGNELLIEQVEFR